MMSENVSFTAPLDVWRGERGTWHLVTIAGDAADQIAMHARLRRLEYGTQRGFGSVKVAATIGGTEWKTSVFPQSESTEWVLLIGKKVMRAEDLAQGDPVSVELEFL